MSKTKVIAFANNKGGSGKTTTCSNVGCAMALMGKKVLMIDGDMQMNLTISLMEDEKAYEYAKGEKNNANRKARVSSMLISFYSWVCERIRRGIFVLFQ